MVDIGFGGGDDVNLVNGENYAAINASGQLSITGATPAIPPGATLRNDIVQTSITGTQDQFFVIPTSEVLHITRFRAGCEGDPNGSKAELYDAPNGTTTGIILIDAAYVNGDSAHIDLEFVSATGDGTKAIMIRRVRFAGASLEVYAKWEGYSI